MRSIQFIKLHNSAFTSSAPQSTYYRNLEKRTFLRIEGDKKKIRADTIEEVISDRNQKPGEEELCWNQRHERKMGD